MGEILYRPLQPNEIRLITLLPGSITSGIQCKLSYHTLDEGPRYDALSYCWGDPKATQKIGLDGRPLDVTAELERALRHLRLLNENRILWVDALCINQNDAIERNHQVADMFYIYQTAQRVRIWIGRESEENDSKLSEELKGHLAQYWEDSKQPAQRYNLRLGFKHGRHWNALKLLELFGNPDDTRNDTYDVMESSLKHSLGQQAWCDLAILASRPYWARVWIQQEIVRQTDVFVHCGWWNFPLSWLYNLQTVYVNYLGTYHDRLPAFQLFIRQLFAHIEFLKLQKGQIDRSDYLTTINTLRHQLMRKTTDPRDKIYGIVGIIGAWRGSFPVDYRLKPDSVYVAAFKFVAMRYRHLRLLADQWVICSLGNLDTLPSWCPDWSITFDHASVERFPRARNSSLWNIPGYIETSKSDFSYNGHLPLDFFFESNDRVLVTSGIVLDVIEELSECFGNAPVLSESQGKELRGTLTLGMKSSGGPYWSFWSSYQQLVPPNHEKPAVSISLIKSLGIPQQHIRSHSEDQLRAVMQTLVADHLTLKPDAFEQFYQPNPREERQLEDGTRHCAPEKETQTPDQLTQQILWESHHSKWTPFTSEFSEYFLIPSRHRRFFVSHNKYMGLANDRAQVGDVICILFGCPRPVVLRKVEDHYVFIGDAYFHGWMYGEAIIKLDEGLLQKQCFRIH